MLRSVLVMVATLFVPLSLFSDMTPAAVTDPDGKKPARLNLPRVRLAKPGYVHVTGGDGYWEQSLIVWRVNSAASVVQAGQLARGTGRGDAPHRPRSLTLTESGEYYFACWHKVRPDANRADAKHISKVSWERSAERLSGDSETGYTLACEDSDDSDYNDLIVEIK